MLLTLGLGASSAQGGINWKAVWLDKPANPLLLAPGAVEKYTVMGLDGANATADLTRSPYLKVVSLDPDVGRWTGYTPSSLESRPGKQSFAFI